MYVSRGDPATYDIQLKADASGHVSALEVLTLLSPQTDIATTVLQNVAQQLNLPGIDFSTLINKDLVLKDAGIVMRQLQSRFTVVSLDDFYGTVGKKLPA